MGLNRSRHLLPRAPQQSIGQQGQTQSAQSNAQQSNASQAGQSPFELAQSEQSQSAHPEQQPLVAGVQQLLAAVAQATPALAFASHEPLPHALSPENGQRCPCSDQAPNEAASITTAAIDLINMRTLLLN